jgi:Flp pilus assembly protein TadD
MLSNRKRPFAFVLLIVIAGGIVAWVYGRPMYHRWREQRTLKQAQEFFGKSDYQNAALALRQVLVLNNANVEAWRLRATITERLRLPNALECRERVVELQPNNPTNQLQLAQTAIFMGNYIRAEKALATIAPAEQNVAAYHQLAAMIALSRNELSEAERQLKEVARLQPENKQIQLNLAVLDLQSGDRAVIENALKSLQQLYENPDYHHEALRQLVLAAVKQKDWVKAVILSRELQSDAKASLDDQLLQLQVLKESKNAEFDRALLQVKETCKTNGGSVCRLAVWLIGHEQANDAASWMASLAEELQARLEVKMTRADCLLAMKDWEALQNLLQSEHWDQSDYLRHAMLARAARERREDLGAQTEWGSALRAAAEHPKQLKTLAQLANSWSWERETEDTLWQIAQRYPGERWALETLHRSFLKSGNTLGLQKLYSELLQRNPNDLPAQNNLATVNLLLNLQTARAHELARTAYESAKTNASFASTYAYSLHLQGKTAEGVAVLETLSAAELEKPEIALYYGVIQTAAAPEKAGKYLHLAEQAAALPEEKALVASARKRLP